MNKEVKLMVRLNDSLKNDAIKVLEGFGLDISTAVRLFLIKIINSKAIPLDPDEDTFINAILMGDFTNEEIQILKKTAREDYKKAKEKIDHLKQ